MREGLQVVESPGDLPCYKCGEQPAVAFRWMNTPSGGRYKRGWCESCLPLQKVPEGESLKCYRCKNRKAVVFKWMNTPSGGRYKRGWCSRCRAKKGKRERPKRKRKKRERKRVLVCSSCGEMWPGSFDGFWLKERDGTWIHWCSGGRPGKWSTTEERSEETNLSEV